MKDIGEKAFVGGCDVSGFGIEENAEVLERMQDCLHEIEDDVRGTMPPKQMRSQILFAVGMYLSDQMMDDDGVGAEELMGGMVAEFDQYLREGFRLELNSEF
jgi:hypothetical protein